MRTTEKLIINAGDISSNFISEIIDTYYLTNFSCQFYWNGNPQGVLSLQSNNNPKNNIWHEIPESKIILDNTFNSFLLEVRTCAFRKIRAKFDHDSGSGLLYCEFIGKGR